MNNENIEIDSENIKNIEIYNENIEIYNEIIEYRCFYCCNKTYDIYLINDKKYCYSCYKEYIINKEISEKFIYFYIIQISYIILKLLFFIIFIIKYFNNLKI